MELQEGICIVFMCYTRNSVSNTVDATDCHGKFILGVSRGGRRWGRIMRRR